MLEAFEATPRAGVSLDRPTMGAEPGDEAPMAERIGEADPGFELVEDRDAIDAGFESSTRPSARSCDCASPRI